LAYRKKAPCIPCKALFSLFLLQVAKAAFDRNLGSLGNIQVAPISVATVTAAIARFLRHILCCIFFILISRIFAVSYEW
jgi:hypothetical protein